MKRANPFVTKGYGGPEYFCDRVKETRDIVELLVNENNIALISPRRLGKTDLIHHCLTQPEIKDHYYTFIIDIYATTSLSDFVSLFGKAILEEQKSKGRKALEGFMEIFKSLRQELSFDINGSPTWSLGMKKIDNPEVTLDEIFHYLNTADKPCLVAIDEFQQVTQYPRGDNVEAALRTYIQRCQNATFLFAGSKRHLMGEIFTSPSRPFYQSVITMGLSLISKEKYASFAKNLFDEYGKDIDKGVVEAVYDRFNGVTSCLQRVMNVLFLRTAMGSTCRLEMVTEAVDYLLDLYTENYETMLSQMSDRQRMVFYAIAAEGEATNITGGSFISKYRLWSSSSVMSAVKGLMEKDFVTEDKGRYFIYDPFFGLWMRREMGL